MAAMAISGFCVAGSGSTDLRSCGLLFGTGALRTAGTSTTAFVSPERSPLESLFLYVWGSGGGAPSEYNRCFWARLSVTLPAFIEPGDMRVLAWQEGCLLRQQALPHDVLGGPPFRAMLFLAFFAFLRRPPAIPELGKKSAKRQVRFWDRS